MIIDMTNDKDEDLRKRQIQDLSGQADGFGQSPMHDKVEESREHKKINTWANLGRDKFNVVVLTYLYILQGIPLGFAGSMPMILQARGADYATQAFFSFAFWPFSVKLLWAPIVDSVYLTRFGRRKCWLIPVQYLIGAFLLYLSYAITSLLGTNEKTESGELPQIDTLKLTGTFIALCFLAATQDIAVDGWALTMLKRENVGWASTCNTVGQTAGYFVGNAVFLALESPDFCNNYLRSIPQETGLVTIEGYMYFWAWIFVISTTLVGLLMSEATDSHDASDEPEGVWETYKILWKIIKLDNVKSLCFMLLTAKIAFAAADGIAGLKMIDGGMKKETLAILGVPMVPIQIMLPLIISRYTNGDQPLSIYIRAYPVRIMMGIAFAILVYMTPLVKSENGEFPMYFYALILISYAIHQVSLYCMFVANMAFNARISDPIVGGTYITLLNTITNLGGNWPVTTALSLVKHVNIPVSESYIDGFYVLTLLCTVIGFLWIITQRSRINRLQNSRLSAWKVI